MSLSDGHKLPVSVVYWKLVSAQELSCFNMLCFAHTCIRLRARGVTLERQCLHLMTDSTALTPPHSTRPEVDE